ncbi:Rid family hydrolase [Anaeromicropila populeti]|uniref:Enamine deaminase RidA, house cleaning of reactive enamine intermediates, YjgF/YER057c/UK114 family n=1 Tax=Anaeromicropila populeti TaxID=37658 RepID=A0A1I6KYL3_9FIRM|nr:Rid family hydrolase [Anaeromicropila populeti]SFR96277.1 Enamine deaminase RidA, house cleaning of reactive enamine intermediates, YjgF/YER057c/UK114 family [Anaeromicropila populeti]
MELARTNYSSGAPLEEKAGYSRMVKTGPFIFVGGTTSVQGDGSVYGENDPYAQTKYVLEKQIKLIEQAGASLENIIKVKIYTTNMSFTGEIIKAYSELLHDIRPLCTVIGISALNRPAQLVEIELDAVLFAC